MKIQYTLLLTIPALATISILLFTFYSELYHLYQLATKSLFEYIESRKITGSIIYIAIFGTASTLLIPTTLPTILAGIIFKPIGLAILLSLLGSQAGILLSFCIGKLILKPYILRQYATNRKYIAINEALHTDAMRLIVLLRLSPIFPFGLCNYLLSTCTVDIKVVMAASLLGNLPGCVFNTIIGNLIGKLDNLDDYKTPVLIKVIGLMVAIIFTFIALIFISFVGKRALRRVIDLEDGEGRPFINDNIVIGDQSML